MFTIPISPTGTITCTSPSPSVFVLDFSHGKQNRVTTPFLEAFSEALDRLEREEKTGVVVFTSTANQKFFSNGFDLEHVGENPDIVERAVLPLLRRLMVYPMPTIALLNGHAFGAGVFIAMAADYRVQNPSRGFFCLPEVDIGLRIPPPIATMIRRKMAHPHAYRTAALEGKRLGGKEALDLGIVDVLGGMEECVGLIEERGLVAKSEGGVYGVLKRDAYSDVLEGFEVGKEGEKAKL